MRIENYVLMYKTSFCFEFPNQKFIFKLFLLTKFNLVKSEDYRRVIMDLKTHHYLIMGDCTKVESKLIEMPLIDLLITSPPYFNAPFDYKALFQNYETFLDLIAKFAEKFYHKLKPGAIAAINIDDMLIQGIKYPIISDSIKIFRNCGYELKGRIIWRKPEGYIRISRRSGVLLQNPYPMYFYPDNLLESILLFQKLPKTEFKHSNTQILEDIWEMTNVLPLKGRLETDIAAFPDELPKRLIEAFTIKGSLICDPFLGSGTTMKVARKLRRNSIGIEKIKELEYVIRKKTGFSKENLQNYFDDDEIVIEKIPNEENSKNDFIIQKNKNYSLLSLALNTDFSEENEYEFHLIILDCRNAKNSCLNNKLSSILHRLHPGRILIVYYDSSIDDNANITLDQLIDFIMSNGIRLRDKITVQHEAEHRWDINTNFNRKIIFKHNYFEVLIFQKGKFNYKSKSKVEKLECLIDKREFQVQKWFLSLWNLKTTAIGKCDQIVTERIIELFLYNNETIGTNLPKISCSKREFILKDLKLD